MEEVVKLWWRSGFLYGFYIHCAVYQLLLGYTINQGWKKLGFWKYF